MIFKIKRKKTRQVEFNKLKIGNNNPIAIESMTNTPTKDSRKTLNQIKRLARAGCDLVRVAVPDSESAKELSRIIEKSPIPVVADIHFDYRLALLSIDAGVNGLRINPGNIGTRKEVEKILLKAEPLRLPVRIGVNLGSLQKDFSHLDDKAIAMLESAKQHIKILEDFKYKHILVSMKSSDVATTIRANRLFSREYNYPLHIGVTEAGPLLEGTVSSSLGIGILLSEGIGDTIRVSLTDDPVREIEVGYEILGNLGLREKRIKIISCPTCGRTQVPVIRIASFLRKSLNKLEKKPEISVAVMGCAVNGPGEARHADLGIAGSSKGWVFFKKGKVMKHLSRDIKDSELIEFILNEIREFKC